MSFSPRLPSSIHPIQSGHPTFSSSSLHIYLFTCSFYFPFPSELPHPLTHLFPLSLSARPDVKFAFTTCSLSDRLLLYIPVCFPTCALPVFGSLLHRPGSGLFGSSQPSPKPTVHAGLTGCFLTLLASMVRGGHFKIWKLISSASVKPSPDTNGTKDTLNLSWFMLLFWIANNSLTETCTNFTSLQENSESVGPGPNFNIRTVCETGFQTLFNNSAGALVAAHRHPVTLQDNFSWHSGIFAPQQLLWIQVRQWQLSATLQCDYSVTVAQVQPRPH